MRFVLLKSYCEVSHMFLTTSDIVSMYYRVKRKLYKHFLVKFGDFRGLTFNFTVIMSVMEIPKHRLTLF